MADMVKWDPGLTLVPNTRYCFPSPHPRQSRRWVFGFYLSFFVLLFFFFGWRFAKILVFVVFFNSFLFFSSFGWWFLKDSSSISTACRQTRNYLLLWSWSLKLEQKKPTSHSHARNPCTPPRNRRVPGLLEWAASGVVLLWSPDNLRERQGQLKINLEVITPSVRQPAHGAFDKHVNWGREVTYTGSFPPPSSRWTCPRANLDAVENVAWWRTLWNGLAVPAFLPSTGGI